MTRNDFLKLAVGLGATLGTLGCSGDDTGDDGADTQPGTAGSSGGNDDNTDGPVSDSSSGSADTIDPDSTGPDGSTSADASSSEGGVTTNVDTGSGDSSEGGSGSTSGGVDCSDDPVVAIGNNHMHALVVPIADVLAAQAVAYDMQGTSGHAHTLNVTAEDFETLAATGTVMVTSTTGGMHTHVVTLTCA